MQVYPEAIAQLPVPPLFNFLFFLMLCLLAMSSVGNIFISSYAAVEFPVTQILPVGTWEPIVGAILDEFPKLRNHRSLVYFGT